MNRVPLGLLILPLLAGCYESIPLSGVRPEPAPGTRLVVELTDEGRVALAPQVGPEVARIEGALVERSDSGYVLGVSAVIGLWGSQSRWTGERVAFRMSQVRRLSERRLSPWRTAVAAGGATAGFVAFVLTRGLIGGGSTSENQRPEGQGNNVN